MGLKSCNNTSFFKLLCMARPLRIEFPGVLYHVTSRGDGCEDIYLEGMAKAYLWGGYTPKQVAEHFRVHYSTVSRTVKEISRRQKE